MTLGRCMFIMNIGLPIVRYCFIPEQSKKKYIIKPFQFPDHSCGILKMNVLDENGLLDKEIGEKIIIAFKEEGFIS